MAHVLNQKERNQAFLKFLFFFLLSTTLVVATVYFDVNIPTKDNEILREQVSRYKNQEMAQEKFAKSMDDTKQMIDSLSKPGANAVYLNQDIAGRIRQLADLQYKDSSMFSRLNKNVIDVFLRYQIAVNSGIQMGDLPQQLAEFKAKYEQSQRDLNEANQTIQAYQRTNNTNF